ncbi:mycothiol synthase [Brachybacterium phenoliresistens]|uniref:mycothiol synthase n=1 Tax=Brachybacterium phenoliresistens TaxID=396014 RepID=UPI0031D48080
MITTDRLTPAARRGIGRLLDACAQADGVSPLDEAARLALAAAPADPSAGPRHLLVPAEGAEAEDPGAVLGYASVLADGTVQGMVDPAHRRRGIGRRLLAEVTALRPDAAVWAHGALAGALALLEGAGYTPRRTLLTLGRPLPGAALPAAESSLQPLEITGFDLDRDGEEWVALNAVAFASHPEQGRMTLADLRERAAQPWFDPEGFFLARHRGELVGFVWTKREGEAAEDGEIYVVGTAPVAQGRGVARLLMVRALDHLARAGCRRAVLYVEGDNAPALSVYRRLGFSTIGRDVQLRRAQEA